MIIKLNDSLTHIILQIQMIHQQLFYWLIEKPIVTYMIDVALIDINYEKAM
jgi:hypothetical protein